VTVRAVDAEGGVRNATVFVESPEGIVDSGPTNANGAFVSGNLERGEYELVLFKSGYYQNETRLVVDRERVQRQVEMRTGSVPVEIQVVDDHFDSPRPLNDAAVEVGDRGTGRTTDGSTLFRVPVNTRPTVTVSKDGYREVTRQVDVGESGRTVRFATQRVPGVTVEPTNRQVVVGETTGVVVRNAYDEPVRGAQVLVDGEQVAETDRDGEATIPIANEGERVLRARSGGVQSAGVTITGVAVEDVTRTTTPTATQSPTPTATQSPTPEPTATTDVALPGFGPVAAVTGLVVLLVVLVRRRR
jgi:hypothetical protein